MKLSVAQALALLLSVTAAAAAAAGTPSANEAAGLPDLEKINGTAESRASASSKVELNTERQPSFHLKDPNGTEVSEYRDRGKPTEILVRSNLGTRYRMTAPADTAPKVRNQGVPDGRVPAIRLSY